MRHILRASTLALLCISLAACGASASSTASTTPSSSAEAPETTEWTSALLRKLDPTLRARVRSGDDDRLAVKVFFQRRVRDSVLSELLLSRVGNHYVGNVGPDTLQRIAARSDVDRIEAIQDLGY